MPIFGQCKHKISTASAVVGTDVVCIIGTAVLIFGQCKHIISTASVAGTDVVCIIGTAVLIFGQCKHRIRTALSLLNLITLFCRDFE